MDSMLLLFLMAELFPAQVRVIYINHQLQSQSTAWGEHVAQQCQDLKLPCVVVPVQVSVGNLENQAREARHQAYAQHLRPNEVLVLGHHQQDQAETMLLRLFSGAGVAGLAAMKRIDQRAHYQIWRPLLDLSREQISVWSAQLNISYVEDPTNSDVSYDRAWCRAQLWPLLSQRYPKMQQAITRSCDLMQDADQILHEVMQQDWAICGDDRQLDLDQLAQLSVPRRRQLLSAWVKGEGSYRPAFDMIQRLQDEVIEAKSDAQAALHWQGFYYLRYQRGLYRVSQQQYLAHQQVIELAPRQISLSLDQTLVLDAGVFQIGHAALGLDLRVLKQKLDLQQRVGGERIHLHGRVGAWPLKKALQQAQIFPWMRHTIQILSIDNVMLGVFTPKGFWLAQSEYCQVGGWLPKLISQY